MSPRTVERHAEFSEAVDALVEDLGPEVREGVSRRHALASDWDGSLLARLGLGLEGEESSLRAGRAGVTETHTLQGRFHWGL